MKILKVILLSLFILPNTFSQNVEPTISFEKRTHDFGDISEEKGVATYNFKFKNIGSQPLVIHNVRASCGCTSPEWTRQPIVPGGEGFIKVAFDPSNRPGNFNKTITINSNATPPTDVLRIVGNVLPRAKTVEDTYPRLMGDVRLKSSHLSFTRVEPNATKNESMEFVNISSNPVSVTFKQIPKHVSVQVVPATVQPGEKGIIKATFDASKIDDWGFVISQMYLAINGVQVSDGRFSVSATIEEDFSKLNSQQLANAPDIQFSETNHDFGTVKQGDILTHTFKITNEGKEKLILRKVKASCGCTATDPDKDIIDAGDSANIKVTFNTRGRSGRQSKSITIYSNDPKKSTMLLRISATIVN